MAVNRVTFLLDRLPLDTGSAMALLEAITKNSDAMILWDENRGKSRRSFRFANLDSYVDAQGQRHEGKKHPHFVLADWLAASLRAGHEPDKYLKGANGNLANLHEVSELSAVWKTLVSQGNAFE